MINLWIWIWFWFELKFCRGAGEACNFHLCCWAFLIHLSILTNNCNPSNCCIDHMLISDHHIHITHNQPYPRSADFNWLKIAIECESERVRGRKKLTKFIMIWLIDIGSLFFFSSSLPLKSKIGDYPRKFTPNTRFSC